MGAHVFREKPAPKGVRFPRLLQLVPYGAEWAGSWIEPSMGFGQASQQRKRTARAFREPTSGKRRQDGKEVVTAKQWYS